ncbi:MAG: PqiC family protein [Verrucomicrobiota bacterium]
MKTLTTMDTKTTRGGVWRVGAAMALAAATAMGLAGCSIIPEATSDPTRFYVLSTPAGADGVAAAGTGSGSAPSIYLRPVEVASYLRARAMVVRRGSNEIEFREFARWGESLEIGVARVLREELLARGAASSVSAGGSRREHVASDAPVLSVRVLACEGMTHGGVAFRAAWELTGHDGKAIASGDYRATDLRWDGKSEASLAAQLSQAVAGLAGEVAAGLAKK